MRLRVRFADERLAPAEDHGVTVMLEQQGRKKQPRRPAARRRPAAAPSRACSSAAAGGQLPRLDGGAGVAGQAAAVDFTVAPPPGEFARVRMDAAEMRQAALETKGRFYTLADADRLPDDLPQGRPVPYQTLPVRAAVEQVAGAAVVSRAADRRMAAAKARRNGIE